MIQFKRQYHLIQKNHAQLTRSTAWFDKIAQVNFIKQSDYPEIGIFVKIIKPFWYMVDALLLVAKHNWIYSP